MEIKNIIVHEVLKDKAGKNSVINPRENENQIDEHAKKLSSQLSALFKKTGLSSGSFSDAKEVDDPRPTFLTLLEKYYIENKFTDFVTFSQSATREFKRKLDKSGGSKGGYLWLNHYIHNEDHFLSVVLLRKQVGLAFVDGLNLGAIEGIDLSTLHMACRINLSNWKSGNNDRYIAFKVGRAAKDVTEYFGKFIGCEEYHQSKEDTVALVNVTKDYCLTHELSKINTEEAKKFVFDQCKGWADNEEPTCIDKLSEMLDAKYNISDDKSGVFLEVAQGPDYELTNEIQINRNGLRSLVRYSGNGKGITISFESNNLGTSVLFHKTNKTLTIKEIPKNLLMQLEK